MQERHVDDLVDAYILDALEPDEVDFVESHLEGCEGCRALVAEARATRDALLMAPPLASPPPALRARVLARLAEEVVATHPSERRPVPTQQPQSPASDSAFQRFM